MGLDISVAMIILEWGSAMKIFYMFDYVFLNFFIRIRIYDL